jgi:nucleotide-binding universal stress UspA family protein
MEKLNPMQPIEKILFPIDFSESTRAMAPFADRAAALFGAQITLVHVIDPRALDLSEQMELAIRPMREVLEDHRATQTERLENFSNLPALKKAPRLLLEGDPSAVITSFARDHNFDLIVMATHSGRFHQRLLGSTTARVINEAVCPVLTNRHAEEVQARPLGHKRWLCAVSLDETSERILEQGRSVALQAAASISVIHVVDSNSNELSASELLKKRLKDHGLDGQGKVATGAIRETLVRSVVAIEADLLIVGRAESDPDSGLMTDLTYAMIRDAPVPVLTL